MLLSNSICSSVTGLTVVFPLLISNLSTKKLIKITTVTTITSVIAMSLNLLTAKDFSIAKSIISARYNTKKLSAHVYALHHSCSASYSSCLCSIFKQAITINKLEHVSTATQATSTCKLILTPPSVLMIIKKHTTICRVL